MLTPLFSCSLEKICSFCAQDGLKDFQAFLETMGGMPVLQGSAWKEVPWWEVFMKTFSQIILVIAKEYVPGNSFLFIKQALKSAKRWARIFSNSIELKQSWQEKVTFVASEFSLWLGPFARSAIDSTFPCVSMCVYPFSINRWLWPNG